ncbi:hypothetical protein BDV97DRAFT_288913 [Delphinella strobiligena]|nr:hypothetical protein BDV97DRAFT_288913 [Delphinella strobiligena]
MAVIRSPTRPGLPSLFRLPPALRHSLYQHHQHNAARQFSLQAITSSVDAATAIAIVPATAMEALHTIGLPWWAVFPVSAVLVRSFLVYPLFQRPLRKSQAERAALQPLIDAKMGWTVRRLVKQPPTLKNGRLSKELMRIVINRKLGMSIFNHPPIPFRRGASFFTLIAMSDSIRKLSGHKEGLLKFLLGPFDWIASWAVPKHLEPSQATGTNDIPLQHTPASRASPEDGPLTSFHSEEIDNSAESSPWAADDATVDTVDAAMQAPIPAPNIALDSPWFEPGLLTGGFSWCPDLTASDPTLVLPFIFTGSFFASIYFSPRIGGGHGAGKATNMQRIGMTIAVLSIFPALKMPVALLMYFIANICVSAVQTRWLAYTVPLRSVPRACKRPVVRGQLLNEPADEFIEISSRTRRH